MDMDNRLPLYHNIMLSGGTTMLPGLATRLERDIRDLYVTRILKVREGHAASDAGPMVSMESSKWKATCPMPRASLLLPA